MPPNRRPDPPPQERLQGPQHSPGTRTSSGSEVDRQAVPRQTGKAAAGTGSGMRHKQRKQPEGGGGKGETDRGVRGGRDPHSQPGFRPHTLSGEKYPMKWIGQWGSFFTHHRAGLWNSLPQDTMVPLGLQGTKQNYGGHESPGCGSQGGLTLCLTGRSPLPARSRGANCRRGMGSSGKQGPDPARLQHSSSRACIKGLQRESHKQRTASESQTEPHRRPRAWPVEEEFRQQKWGGGCFLTSRQAHSILRQLRLLKRGFSQRI